MLTAFSFTSCSNGSSGGGGVYDDGGLAYYYVEAINKECTVAKFSADGSCKMLESKVSGSVNNYTLTRDNVFKNATVQITPNGDTATADLDGPTTLPKLTGDLYGYTNVSQSGNNTQAYAIILNGDGTGKYIVEVYNMTSGARDTSACRNANFTYTISGTSFSANIGGTTYTGTIASDGSITLAGHSRSYKKF